MQIDSSLGTMLPLTELGLLIEVACNRSSLHIVVAKWVRMPGATTRRCLPILEEEQRRRRADFAASCGRYRRCASSTMPTASPSSPRLDLTRKSHLRYATIICYRPLVMLEGESLCLRIYPLSNG